MMRTAQYSASYVRCRTELLASLRNCFMILILCSSFSMPLAVAAEAIPENYDSLIQLALQQRNSGDFVEAEATLLQARSLALETNEVDLLLGLTVAFQERFVEANSILSLALERYPQDSQLILAKARVLSYQGIYDESISMANAVLSLQPESIDARNLLARVHYYQRAYSQSRQFYYEALEIDEQNLEAIVGLYDVELASGNDSEAEQALLRAEQIDPSHVDVIARRQRQVQPIARPHELSTSFELSDFDQSVIDEWYDRSLEYRFRSVSGNQYFLRAQHSHRFGSHDTLLETGVWIDRSGGMPIEVSIASTANDEFLPEKRLRVGTQLLLNAASEDFGSTTLGLTYTAARYQTGNVNSVNLNFTHYFLGFNGWLTPGLSRVKDENGDTDIGWRLGLHWQPHARLLVGYNYGDAPETENSITTETNSDHIYARYQLSDALILRLDLSRNERERSYTREAAALTLQYRY